MRLKGSIFHKVLFVTVLSSVVAGGIVLAMAAWQQSRHLTEHLIETNRLLAEVAAEAVEAGYVAQQWPFDTLKQIAESRDVDFLWVVKPDGEIYLADDPQIWGRKIDDSSLGSQELVIKDILSYKTYEGIKIIVHPLKMGEVSKPWSLYLGVSLESLIAARNEMIGRSVGFFVAIILLASLLSFRLAKGVTKPLEYLTEGVRTISKGNLDYRIELKTGDEIEELGNDFDQMAEELGNKIKETEEARDQLTELNKELQIEITERKQMEKNMKESEEKYRSLVNNVKLGVFRSTPGPTGRFLEVNPAIEEITGYSREELLQMDVCDLYVHSEEREAVLEEAASSLGNSTTELCFKRKDGAEIIVSDTKVAVRDSTGEIVYFDGILEDITERKLMEHELREAQEQLIRSERLAAIGQLAGGVGHELRNPLGAIKNAVYYVKGKVAKSELTQKEPRVMEFLDVMDDEINSSSKIINDLLGFSRVGKPAVSPIRIEKVIEDALSRTPIPESIELTKKLDTELPEVEIDADQIQQVVVNMITNAVQAMPEGGKLTISAREKGKFLELEIADTGGGIPVEAMGKIFDPLFTTRAKGIGLGLAVCKSIIDRHGGHIEVKSQVGKGTTFNIKLPLKAA